MPCSILTRIPPYAANCSHFAFVSHCKHILSVYFIMNDRYLLKLSKGRMRKIAFKDDHLHRYLILKNMVAFLKDTIQTRTSSRLQHNGQTMMDDDWTRLPSCMRQQTNGPSTHPTELCDNRNQLYNGQTRTTDQADCSGPQYDDAWTRLPSCIMQQTHGQTMDIPDYRGQTQPKKRRRLDQTSQDEAADLIPVEFLPWTDDISQSGLISEAQSVACLPHRMVDCCFC